MKECIYLLPDSAEMPCWYYDKKDLKVTPSIQDGISFETERRYRKEGARFIMNCGTQMGLGHNTMATGVVYFHRFYMFHTFKNFPRYVTACCCLLLAGKVEETPKKCRDIIRTARSLLTDAQFFSFGDDPKEEVMTLERILLQTIKFDLQVEHPYSFLLKYAKCIKGDQAKLQKMVQMAWNFVNDSLSTVVCLQWEPEIIAVALIHLASKLSKFTVVDWVGRQPSHLRWWDMFVSDVTMEILEDICHQVLDLYQPSHANNDTNSPPQKPPSRAESPTNIPQTQSVARDRDASPAGLVNSKNSLPPQQQSFNKPLLEEKMEGIPIATTSSIKPLQPPPEPMPYMYTDNYMQMYTHNSHYPPQIPGSQMVPPTSAPPPLPPPPMYGAQFPMSAQPIPSHYGGAAPPPLPSHRSGPPPQHIGPPMHQHQVPPSGGYYQPPYHRQRYQPPT
ncbi:cyclin-K [Episyrphus balteatus]|uniref:cyclin-K n=1 Tax=Episyrphus balteatus TaxID=286459 RepID=UPI002485D890|nr:cyclin-K [Episyrphus balteatus]